MLAQSPITREHRSRTELFVKLLRKLGSPRDLFRFLDYKFRHGNEYPYFDLVDVFPQIGRIGAAVPARLQIHRPIFIAGLRRSGSTLFYRIMNSNRQLFLFNERTPGVGMNGLGIPNDRNVWSIADPVELRRVMLRYLSPALRCRGGRWGVKLALELAHPDPGSTSSDGLRRLVAAFPESTILGIVRDPRTFVVSALKRAGRDVHWWVDEYLAMTVLFRELLETHGDRFRCVRYEDITDSAEATIRACCEFAGLTYAPGMLDSANWSIKGPKEYDKTGIARGSSDRNADDAERASIVRIVRETCFPAAEMFGYAA